MVELFGDRTPMTEDERREFVLAWCDGRVFSDRHISNRGMVGTVFMRRNPTSGPDLRIWGTTLKPAWEPIILARKKLIGAVAQNVLEHGTGGLNIGATRIGIGDGGTRVGEASANRRYTESGATNFAAMPGPRGGSSSGRFPANLTLSHSEDCVKIGTTRVRGSNTKPDDVGKGREGQHTKGIYRAKESKVTVSHTDSEGMEEVLVYACVPNCPVRLLDDQAGNRPGMPKTTKRKGDSRKGYGGNLGPDDASMSPGYGDSGGPSRFFLNTPPTRFLYTSKASRRERSTNGTVKNDHVTVKPLALMQYLLRLVAPPGGVVLDQFCGSGSTLIAAHREGIRAIGVDNNDEYLMIALERLDAEENE